MRILVVLSALVLLAACTTSPQVVPSQSVTMIRASKGVASETAFPTGTPSRVPTVKPTQTSGLTAKPTPTIAPSSILAATTSPNPTVTPSAEPTQESTPLPTQILPTQDCIDKAAFSADVTVPDSTTFHIGETFTKTWKIHNEGTCTWKGYSMIYVSGEVMNAPLSNPIQEVAPGEYADISIQFQAPQRGGKHTGYWEFVNAAGKTFGVGSAGEGLLWVQINVDFPTLEPTTDSESDSSSSDSPTETPSGSCAYTLNSDYESQLLSLINDVRAQNGLNALTLDSRLQAAALVHSLDMACNNYVNHTGSDGSTWYDRVKAQGFRNFHSARENIYVGNPAFGGDAQGAFTWWMNSDIHRKTILLSNITVIGISYVFTSTSTYGGYYTAVFARP